MGGRASREKGKRGERATVHEMAEVFGEAVKRGLSQTRDGSEDPDVVLPKEVPLWIEVKTKRTTSPRAALVQAQAAINQRFQPFEPAPFPLAVCRDTGKEPLAAMYLTDFRVLLCRWWSLEQQAAHLAAALDEVAGEAGKEARR